MLSMAVYMRDQGHRVGILNPSDWEALHRDHGHVGMYWSGGHVALEEVLALRSTLLLQNKGLNPALFATDPKKTKLPDALLAEARAVDPEPPS